MASNQKAIAFNLLFVTFVLLVQTASNLRSWPPTALQWPPTKKRRPLTYYLSLLLVCAYYLPPTSDGH